MADAQDLPPDQGRQAHEGIFKGETINTPSMLAVEDAIDGLNWAEVGRRSAGLIARSEANLAALADWVAEAPGPASWPTIPAMRSCTSICLRIRIPEFTALDPPSQAAAAKKRRGACWKRKASRYDIARLPRRARRACGSGAAPRSSTADIEALLPWLDWAFATGQTRAKSDRAKRPCNDGRPSMMPKVLISDKLSPAAVEIFRERGIEVDVKTGLKPARTARDHRRSTMGSRSAPPPR